MKSCAISLQHWHVSSVRVRGFKSFSTLTELHFTSPFLLGVVGPNGCGKSTLLEALQFAAGSPAQQLRVKTLKELCSSSNAEQLCEVEFTLTQAGIGATPTHKIRAALTPDGSRAFQIDGKNKSAAQIKEFLRARGICLHGPSVIRQATITQLADANSPQDIAKVIAEASGLARWDQETTRAMGELKAARQTLQDIKGNIAKLQQLIAKDNQRLEGAEHASHTHDLIQRLSSQLAYTYKQQQAAAAASISARDVEIVMAQDQIDQASEDLQHLEQQLTAARSHCNKSTEGGGQSSITALMTEQVVLEEQVKQAEAKVQAAKKHAAQFTQGCAQLERLRLLSDAQAVGLQDLEARVEELSAQAAEAEGGEGDEEEDVQEHLARARDRLDSCRSSLEANKAEERALVSKLQQLQRNLATAQADLSRLQPQCKVLDAACKDATPLVPRLTEMLDEKQRQAQDLQVSYQETLVKQQVHQAQMGIHKRPHNNPRNSAHPPPANNSTPSVQRLHELFSFPSSHTGRGSSAADKEKGGQLQQLCKALAVIAGSSLQVVVVPDSSTAKQLLDDPVAFLGSSSAGQTLRIWPLDQITCSDQTAAQRRAQSELGAGCVILPMDLLHYQPQHKAAILRAFGSSVIACDSATAAGLATRYNLSSVTPDGTVSRRGTVSGGYQGRGGQGASPAETLLLQKQELSVLEGKATKEAAKLKELHRASAELEARLQSAQGSIEAAAQQRTAVAAAEKAVQLLQANVDGVTEGLRIVRAQIKHATADVERYTAQLTHYEKLAGGESTQPQQQKHLREDTAKRLQAAQAELAGLQQQHERLQSEQQQLQERQSTLYLQLGIVEEAEGATDEQQLARINAALQDLADALGEKQEQLSAVRASVGAARATEQQEHKAQHDQSKQLAALDQERQAVKEEMRHKRDRLTGLQEQLRDQHKALKQLQKAAAQHLKQFPEATLPTSTDQTGAEETTSNESDTRSMQAKLEALRKELKSLDGLQMSVMELAQYKERRDSVRLFEERCSALASGSDLLEAGIRDSHRQVLDTHLQVLHSISRRFEAMCSVLLPGLEFVLSSQAGEASNEDHPHAPGKDGDDGALIQFRSVKDAGAAEHRWQQNLDQLSGGQRTLVSLSLLLAAACCEGSRSSVLLMDEVDAALDEHNQGLVAQLCHALAHGRLRQPPTSRQASGTTKAASSHASTDSSSACLQVVCVSHHAAFQKSCDALVKISIQNRTSQAAQDHAGKKDSAVPAAPAQKKPAGRGKRQKRA